LRCYNTEWAVISNLGNNLIWCDGCDDDTGTGERDAESQSGSGDGGELHFEYFTSTFFFYVLKIGDLFFLFLLVLFNLFLSNSKSHSEGTAEISL
jgi:hypothetical protein